MPLVWQLQWRAVIVSPDFALIIFRERQMRMMYVAFAPVLLIILCIKLYQFKQWLNKQSNS